MAAAEGRGLLFSVFQNRRWDSDFLTLRSVLADGSVGDVARFESRYERWVPERRAEAWRERAGTDEAGGLLFDLGSHLIDQALQLFGRPTAVAAELDRRRPGAEVDDDAFVALEHEGGVRTHLWMSAVAADLGPRFRVLGSDRAYVVHGLDGQEAALRAGRTPADPDWGLTPPAEYGRLGADPHTGPEPTLPGGYQRYYAGVAEALRGRGPVPVDARDAVATLTVLEAARRSAAEQRVVVL